MNISDEIKRLHDLHQAGALTSAEFEQAKAKLLSASVNLNKAAAPHEPSRLPEPGPAGLELGNGDLTSEVSRLRRSRGDRWLGGVCGGLGKVSGVDSWVWRAVFAFCVIFAGFGLLIYLLMWIFVPEE